MVFYFLYFSMELIAIYDNMQTNKHNWHVHKDQIGDDWQLELSKRCKSIGGHYNPYNVNTQVSKLLH